MRRTLETIAPRGLQIGQTTRITITGNNFGTNPRLHLDVDGQYSQAVVEASGQRLVADVTIDQQVPAGIYPLRIATDAGISNAMVIGVDRLPQIPFQNQVESLPVALHGSLSGDQILRVRFRGHADQPIVIGVEGRRLGSKIRPVIRLSDSNGRQITFARPSARIAGDARIETKLPGDGDFEIELHDVVYQGPGPGWFRLKIGDLKFADLAFPPAVSAQSDGEVEFGLSNLSTAVRVPARLTRGSLIRVPWPDSPKALYTAAAPRVALSTFGAAEYREQEIATKSDLQLPVGISGRLLESGEEDEYAFQVSPKSKLRFEVTAQRLGSPLDAVLVVSTKDGKQLGRSDDQSGTRDPGTDIAIPADVTQVVARISSLIRQHGRDCVYRLTVQPSAPKWQLNTAVDRLNIPAGSRQIIALDIERGGSKGSLDLQLSAGLDGAVSLENPRLRPEDEIGLLAIRAADSTRGIFTAHVSGFDSSANTAGPVVRLSTAAFPGSEYQPDLRESLTLSVIDPAPVDVAWSDDVDALQLARGTQQPLQVDLRRADAAPGKIRLSLLTSQKPPTKKEGNKQVPDLDRTLRLEPPAVILTDETDETLQLLVPADLPLHSWAFAVKAELLSEDEKRVEATAFTRILRANTVDPLQLMVELPAEINVEVGEAEPTEIKGTIRRHAGFAHPVQVTLQGLPKEVKLPPVILAANETEFVIPLAFDIEAKTGEYKDVRLLATYVDPDLAVKGVRSRSGNFTVKITKPE